MGRFLPSSKDGGPIKTIVNLINIFSESSNFYVLTGDRDVGDKKTFEKISVNQWTKFNGFNVCYLKNNNFSFSNIMKFSKNIQTSILICGVFNNYVIKTLILKKIGFINKKINILPMGSFSKGAIEIKKTKKYIYFFILRLFNLLKNVDWIVSSEFEKNDLISIFPSIKNIKILSDLPNKPNSNILLKTSSENLKVIFLSRISPKKNLDYAIKIISQIKFNLEFNIYGNIEDVFYWNQCLLLLNSLPKNIKWNYFGHILPAEVDKAFQTNDVFIFPTKGENFGHVIFEALSNGCIPLISDQTPWNDINDFSCGRVTSLQKSFDFLDFLNHLNTLDRLRLNQMKQNCINYSHFKFTELINQSKFDF